MYSDTAPAKIAKSFLEKLTNNQNLGGIKLLRGYNEVEKETAAKKEQDVKKDAKTTPDEAADANKKLHLDLQDQQQPRLSTDSAGGDLSRNMSPQNKKELEEKEMIQQRAEDYDNEDSEEDVRNIDQIVFVIHGQVCVYWSQSLPCLLNTHNTALGNKCLSVWVKISYMVSERERVLFYRAQPSVYNTA